VCLDDASSCVADGSFSCNAYPSASAAGCGAPAARLDGTWAYPPDPRQGTCRGGVAVELGTKQPGESCSAWHECESAHCGCGSADCSARVCWAPGDCGGDLCKHRVDAATCAALVPSGGVQLACGGGDFMGVDLRGSCVCEPQQDGSIRMREAACDDGISNDWAQSNDPTDRPDWHDADCLIPALGSDISLWQFSVAFRNHFL
jgi:hypothetical protein